jgi:hypothetical protein
MRPAEQARRVRALEPDAVRAWGPRKPRVEVSGEGMEDADADPGGPRVSVGR